jgi:hypothetical protein
MLLSAKRRCHSSTRKYERFWKYKRRPMTVLLLGSAAVQVQGNMEDSGKEGFTKSL